MTVMFLLTRETKKFDKENEYSLASHPPSLSYAWPDVNPRHLRLLARAEPNRRRNPRHQSPRPPAHLSRTR